MIRWRSTVYMHALRLLPCSQSIQVTSVVQRINVVPACFHFPALRQSSSKTQLCVTMSMSADRIDPEFSERERQEPTPHLPCEPEVSSEQCGGDAVSLLDNALSQVQSQISQEKPSQEYGEPETRRPRTTYLIVGCYCLGTDLVELLGRT